VCGGPRGGEGLLIGMKNGLIVKVWINSNYPSKLYKHTSGIRCLDISSSRNCLAIVDECANVLVYNLQVSPNFLFPTRFACDSVFFAH
jgi:intraflagellar transport protein 122